MRIVLAEIIAAKERFARLPLFERMRSEGLSPRARLSFFPCLAPFVMAYGDLQRQVFRDEARPDPLRHFQTRRRDDASGDPVQELIDAHCHNGGDVWTCYLDDLARLGLDRPERRASEFLRLYAADGSRVGRMLGPRLARLLFDARPIEKLLMLEAIEAACGVLWSLGAELARRIEREQSVGPRYFGLSLRPDLRGQTLRVLRVAGLSDHDRAWCLVLVNHLFQLFSEWTDELLAYAGSSCALDQVGDPPGTARNAEWPVSGATRV